MPENPAQEAVDIFHAAFNARTEERMTDLLLQAFTPDVLFWGPLGRTEGLLSVEGFMNSLRGHPRGPGRIVRTTAVDAPGEWARYGWAYRDASGATVLEGTDMVHLRDVRIDQMVVFSGPLPRQGG
ncbi:nuclear transport factor 2 family protein [Streptomyces sp. YIM 98790]|uniref:nuclear transport factor 2 family protein n=1 Tax=Streptomyces sp. YIM 98790 TaxID=2689077 RepID=UPI00140CFF19|nr:nuclear transport factor 2 family protein [Streptomyces sp. YIM 98790]